MARGLGQPPKKRRVRSGPTPEARVAEPNADHESRPSSFSKLIEDHKLVSVDWRHADSALDRKVYGVNWSAIGMVTPDEALDFGNAIVKAAELARILNEQEATEPRRVK